MRKYLHHQLFTGVEFDGRLTLLNRLLVGIILLAVLTAVLSTEADLHDAWHFELLVAEAVFGAIFLAEYLARIYAAAENPGPESDWAKRWRFIRSPLGLIDLAVVVASLLPLFVSHSAVLRTIRLLRVIAVMKFGRFARALGEVWGAVKDRGDDLLVTLVLAGMLLLFGATALYLTEGDIQPEQFGSIPRSLWWAVITLTTVGYGDAFPITPLGKIFASLVALSGIALVAMPTGIIAAAFSEAMQRRRDQRIEEMRAHLERLDQVDEAVEAKIAALERTSNPKP